ncbi:PEP-CTERM sorting domain-containing protein [Rubinisphaera brasiliensis]|uniref:PEP motif putative anchor domain protein n=1 Tax=Rubinisphaera brasiliensis (strain ATCC 49424 / DSM 5305 / JCM 21570 / IAM 15109 / NBRC 103401 / IFAM 1448) TaxID=756272 RepID=F0SI63_RUBBR|nr:PEP-CTERM sorting domain-containing protein [Rubinisphaera brasiliensis]ADY61765.1 PEP motif putative anchor domain protein [Rubinisphaera brasiliensis DSM 5305]
MRLKWCLILLATVLLAGSSANASLVIDNFNPGGINLNGPGTQSYALNDDVSGLGTFDLSNVGGGSGIQAGGGALTVSLLNTFADTQVTITYSLDTPLDLHSSGAFPGSPLVLDLFDTLLGTFELDVTYTGAAGSATIKDIAITTPGQAVGINGGQFGNGAIASAVDEIKLEFRATSLGFDGFSNVAKFSGTSIAAVPEPTTMALLTPLMLGGVFYRRRKTKEADQAKI